MGKVTEHLTSLLAKAVNDHGIVVWYDPERHYENLIESLELAGAHLARFRDSFFALRHEIEPFLSGPEPGRLLVYVPLDHDQTHDALVEAGAVGSAARFSLAALARQALEPFVGVKNAAAIETEVQTGKLNLEDLDRLDLAEGITRGVVALILGSGSVQDIALRFLTGEQYDAEITSRNATAELVMLINNGFESTLSAAEGPGDVRLALARHVLTAEFISSLDGPVPEMLAAIKTAEKPATRAACAALVIEWRNRQDLSQSYAKLADSVSAQLQLSGMELPVHLIASSETFREGEKMLCRAVTAGIIDEPTEEMVSVARKRQSSFWSEHLPELQAQWALIAVAGQLLLEAQRLERETSTTTGSASEWITSYTAGERPWCLLDTHQRHLERRFHNFDFGPGDDDEQLSRLVAKARQRYMVVGGLLSDQFLRRLREDKFRTAVLLQADIYDRRVRRELEAKRTAYVWVDALRFEMGRELAESLEEDFDVSCEAAIAGVPTITEIGMAALLPGDEKELVPITSGKLGLKVDGTIVGDRKDRVRLLQEKAGEDVVVLKLEDLLPKPKRKTEENIRNAHLILVTSQEIDELCEGDNVPFARSRMDSILRDLHRAFRVLASLGIQRFIVTADHGYIFGEDLNESMKVDPPRGETVDLHRRVWVGRGGEASDSFLRARLQDFGLGSDLEIATPWGFGAFRVPGGAKAFFHGGLSLQELIVPVLTLTPRGARTAEAGARFAWTLVPGSKTISTRFFSVQIKGAPVNLFEQAPPKVRVEVRLEGKVISTPVSASYGFEEATADVQLRLSEDGSRSIEPDTITLLIQDDVSRGRASVHLLDAISGVEFGRLSGVEIAISI